MNALGTNIAHPVFGDRRSRIGALVIIALFLVVNARWIWLYRRGQLVDVDEAAYFSTAIIDYVYGSEYGLRGWIFAVWSPSIEAPLTTAFTSLLYAFFGLGATIGFATPLIAGTVCVAGAYALGRSLGSPRAGVIAAALTATCPVIVNYSRAFAFATPAALFTTLTLVAFVKSRRFQARGWTYAFGICLGLMPLARTMTLAFIPGLAAAALLALMVDSDDRPRRIGNLAISLLLGAIVFLSWYVKNGLLVLEYLVDFGYGSHQNVYLQENSLANYSKLLDSAKNFLEFLYLPHVLYIMAGAFAGVFLFARLAVREGFRAAAGRSVRSPAVGVALFLAAGVVVLSSTGNKGTGFIAPLVPGLMALGATAICRLGEGRAARLAHGALAVGVALIAGLPLLDLRPPLSNTWSVTLPVFGPTVVAQGRARIHLYQEAAGLGDRTGPVIVDDPQVAAWRDLSARTAQVLHDMIGPRGAAVYAFCNALYNYNTVNLDELLERRQFFTNARVDPVETGDSVEGYSAWIGREVTGCAVLLTFDRTEGDLAAPVTRAFMDDAVARAGLVTVASFKAPDGGDILLWRRPDRPARCQ